MYIRTLFSRHKAKHPKDTATMFKNNTLFRTIVQAKRTKITLPDLKYDFGALEPFISGQINELHYTKHHQTYVNGFNQANEQFQELSCKLDTDPLVISKKLNNLQKNLKFHSGGYINHCYFWDNLSPVSKEGGALLDNDKSKLGSKIVQQYGSVDKLISVINGSLAGVQGSGWSFLVYNTINDALEVRQTYNQDTISEPGVKVLLAIDAWEHAYYLQYQNKKVDYFNAIWNVINWKEAERRFNA